MKIEICVGSSCHIKGSPQIVELLESNIKLHNLEQKITLTGTFCAGKCNREGVTIIVDDEYFIGITKENFKYFWQDNVLSKLKGE